MFVNSSFKCSLAIARLIVIVIIAMNVYSLFRVLLEVEILFVHCVFCFSLSLSLSLSSLSLSLLCLFSCFFFFCGGGGV